MSRYMSKLKFVTQTQVRDIYEHLNRTIEVGQPESKLVGVE